MDKKQILENNGVKFTPINCNRLQLSMPNVNYEITREGNDISMITYNEESINLGDRYVCNMSNGKFKIPFKVNNITISEADQRDLNLFEGFHNCTTLFALPLIFINKEGASFIDRNIGYLINAYVSCDFVDQKSRYSVFLLLKYLKSDRFKHQEKLITENKNFVRVIDIHKDYVLYEMLIPADFERDFDRLLATKYSKLSDFAKNKIVTFHGKSIEGKVIQDALIKSQSRVLELCDEFNMEAHDFEDVELYEAFGANDVLTKNML